VFQRLFGIDAKTKGRPGAAHCFTLFSLVNGTGLESRAALLRFIGADIAGHH
jgi:hypothetical protein